MSAGKKNDNNKPEMGLIPPAAAFEEAAVWTYGKKKYEAFNWHKGISYTRILSAMERHMTLLKSGIDFDYENGLHNAAAIRCCAAMLIHFTLEGRTDLDDRMILSDEVKEYMNRMAQGDLIMDLINVKK